MKKRFIVVGLGFGDEGKGSIVDYLVREHRADAVVRYNGGSQCGHRVVAPDDREHVFAQFGSGTFVDGVETHLSKHVIVNPTYLFAEEEGLQKVGVDDALDRLTIDADALVATPFHVALNRVRELARGDGRHGTCGHGIGEVRSDTMKEWMPVVRMSDVFFENGLYEKLRQIQFLKRQAIESILDHPDLDLTPEERLAVDRELVEVEQDDIPEILVEEYGMLRNRVVSDWDEKLRNLNSIVFEGAQGILLDEVHGFKPHVTWTNTTSGNAHRLLDAAGCGADRRTIGVVRCYLTRHGAGPFPTESPVMTSQLREPTNGDDGWQGPFRVGTFDATLVNQAVKCDGRIDEVALTCIDRRPEFPVDVEKVLGLPVAIRSHGPTAHDKTP